MENLTLLEKQTLAILTQLEYCVDIAGLHNPENKKDISITFGDIDFSVLKNINDLYVVAMNLRKYGLNFSVTYDLTNNEPSQDVYFGHAVSEDEVEVGEIKGESIEDIKTKVKELINELKIKDKTQKHKNITYNINIGQFIFNGKDRVGLNGKQKIVSNCLVEAGENIKVSWDEIHEKMEELITITVGETLNKKEAILAKKSINGVVSEINKKTEKYLEPEKLLIDFKENEYWLQYKVNRDG